jgi:glycerol-3-phosphate O-acyltransferase/dihydroxyacetone phosphate acyltransferase
MSSTPSAHFPGCLLTVLFISAKRLVAAWRVLVGVWAPKSWDLPLAALSQYTTPATPPENPWIQKTKQTIPTVEEPPVTSVRKRRPPTRRVIRHVLRARAEAAKSLATFFDQLDKGGETKVKASIHLARTYGWVDGTAAEGDNEPLGWRHAKEVLFFLRKKGAKVASLQRGIEGEWAALNSDGEISFVDGSENSRDEDVVYVPSRNND